MQITRYDNREFCLELTEASDGEWCSYEEVEKLLTEKELEIAKLQIEVKHAVSTVITLQKLREEEKNKLKNFLIEYNLLEAY